MIDFEALQNDWKSIEASNIVAQEKSNSLIQKLKKLNKKIIYGNILASTAFIATAIVLGWIWQTYQTTSITFYVSITSMFVLLIISMLLLWYRVLSFKPSFVDRNVKAFVFIFLKKLKYYKWISNIYLPIYTILLSINLALYFQDILNGKSFWFTFWAYFLTFGWIIVASFIFIPKKQKKNKKEIDPLLQELKHIKESL